MKKIVSATLQTMLVLAALDAAILMTSMAQIALEGETGAWHPFWASQAKFVLWLIS